MGEYEKIDDKVYVNTDMSEYEKILALRESQKEVTELKSRLEKLEDIVEGLVNG